MKAFILACGLFAREQDIQLAGAKLQRRSGGMATVGTKGKKGASRNRRR